MSNLLRQEALPMGTMRRGQQRAWEAGTHLLGTLTDELDCAINVCRQAEVWLTHVS